MNTALICLCLTAWMLLYNPLMAYHDLIYHNAGRDFSEEQRKSINKQRRMIYYGAAGYLSVMALISLFF